MRRVASKIPFAADALSLTIDLVEPLGSETVIHGRLPGGELLVARLPLAASVIGAVLPVLLPASAWHVFAADGARFAPLHPAPG